MPSFPFDVRGYIENTTNIEYLKEEDSILIENAYFVNLQKDFYV